MIFKFRKKKKFDLINHVIIKTGLASITDGPTIKEINKNAVIPPFASEMHDFCNERFKEMITTFCAVYLHNAIFCDDFPKDAEFLCILESFEKELKKNFSNPWVSLLYEYGKIGRCPTPEEIEFNQDPLGRAALGLTRQSWVDLSSKHVNQFVSWCIKNRIDIESWQVNRINSLGLTSAGI